MVAMYKDDPGVYLDENGVRVPHDVAERAGFDVRENRIERRRRELMKEKEAEVERELAAMRGRAEAEVAEQAQAEVAEPATMEATPPTDDPRESERLLIRHRGGPRWDVVSKETGQPIEGGESVTRAEAEALILADRESG